MKSGASLFGFQALHGKIKQQAVTGDSQLIIRTLLEYMNAQVYTAFNNSFRRKLVYRIGVNAGFFSEINNMLLAMVYCLNHRIRFVLYSQDTNFGLKSWADCFYPFASESRFRFHSTYNSRIDPLSRHSSRKIDRRKVSLLKAATSTDFLTQDLFQAIRDEAKSGIHYDFPELQLSGDIREVLRALSGYVWRLNESTAALVETRLDSLSLPENYVSFHIRSGDKASEAPVYPVDAYVEASLQASTIRTAFVGTDDYTNIEKLIATYPDWQFYFFCDDTQRGYAQAQFEAKSNEVKRRETVELLATVEAMMSAQLFVGTFTSNVGSFVGMRMEPERCLDVSGSTWFVW